MEPQRRRFAVEGRVQGVGFRAWTARQASTLGLSGIVRNQPDGAVEIEVAGQEPALVQFREWLTKGPHFAAVRLVRDLPCTERVLPADFRIVD
jgi:acylphosphatase